MTTNEVLLLVAAILAMISMGAGMTYWSRRNYDELRRVVAASDEAMRQEVTLHPKAKKTGSSMFIVYEIVTDPALIASHLRELAGRARQGP